MSETDSQADATTPGKPLGAIALALSGGGYRAAAFHLGALETFHELGVLEDVAVLSTVSGGTFVGAGYAAARARGESFEKFRADFHERLRTKRPVHRATEILTSKAAACLPRRTLIAAQAEAIHEQFFTGQRFGVVFDHPTHLEEISFNATDFRAGLPFRFQKSLNARVKIGNGKHFVPVELAKELRLADVVAASSCFPGGFEPIGFPHDFVWPDRTAAMDILDPDHHGSPFAQPVPLMDGGVADNQGLGSLLEAIKRRKSEDGPAIGLIFISDADQANERPLLEHHRQPTGAGMRVGTLFVLARVLMWMAAIATVLSGWRIVGMLVSRQLGSLPFFIETILSFTVVFATWLAMARVQSSVRRQLLDRVPFDLGLDVVSIAKQTTVGWLLDLMLMRAESLFAMSNAVFMKNLRDLRYRDLYSDPRFRRRVIANLIYELAAPKQLASETLPQLTTAMQNIARRASQMPTSLWFSDDTELEEAVLCGRFTACFNLVQFLQDNADSPAAVALRSRAENLWRRLVGECDNHGSTREHSAGVLIGERPVSAGW